MPSPTDSVDAKLTPREAVLTRNAAELLGRDKIEQLNAMGNHLAQQGVDLPTMYAQGTEDVRPDTTEQIQDLISKYDEAIANQKWQNHLDEAFARRALEIPPILNKLPGQYQNYYPRLKPHEEIPVKRSGGQRYFDPASLGEYPIMAQYGNEDVNMNNPLYYADGTSNVGPGYDPSYPGPVNPTGSGSGVPTQKGIGLGANVLGNLLFPGLGMLTGPLASYVTKMIQQRQAQNQVQGAVSGVGQSGSPVNPVTGGGYGDQPVWGDSPYKQGFDPSISFNYAPSGPNTQSGIGGLGSSGMGGGYFGSSIPGGNEQNFMPSLGFAMPDAGGGGAYGGNTMAKIAMHGSFKDIATPEQWNYMQNFLSGGGGKGSGQGIGGAGRGPTHAYQTGTSDVLWNSPFPVPPPILTYPPYTPAAVAPPPPAARASKWTPEQQKIVDRIYSGREDYTFGPGSPNPSKEDLGTHVGGKFAPASGFQQERGVALAPKEYNLFTPEQRRELGIMDIAPNDQVGQIERWYGTPSAWAGGGGDGSGGSRYANPTQGSFARVESGVYSMDPTGDYAKATAGTGGPSEFGEGVGRAGKALSGWGAHMADLADRQAQTATSQGLSVIGGIGGNAYSENPLAAYYASLQNPTMFRGG